MQCAWCGEGEREQKRMWENKSYSVFLQRSAIYIGKQASSEIINSLVELDQWRDSLSPQVLKS